MANKSDSKSALLGRYVLDMYMYYILEKSQLFCIIGWFKGLSSSFLSQRTAKLLVLAGAESLDKDLMIGQMQGKYQLAVFQDVGHCLQEEAPKRLAILLLEFWRRNLGARDQAKILKNVRKIGGP